MKIATWNVNSLKVRLPQVAAWLKQYQFDVLCVQETKLQDEFFPKAEIEALGYHVIFAGQRTYNGVAVIAKASPILIAHSILTDDPQRRFLAVEINGILFVNVYVPNGESVTSDKYQYKLSWLSALNAYLAEALSQYKQIAVLGDFNIAPTDLDVRHPERWQDQVLCSAKERAAFQSLLSLGFVDSHRALHPEVPGYTWWDYRLNAFARNWGLRIDHILLSSALATHLTACDVDLETRKVERPSDHALVSVELNVK